ncbi:right-handed parallel beta-helix repeat-containing protein [Membranihabitans maritimus]|uniref:right-handed parallel beta-helix repeat-containing protein n=1 Tax=Membranihabitans maritimus TaxID=2904244 RepID=UPI001F43EDB9|nr:right-handed parallel beta-helix repeat-containing protein [Membranihabitans maritimus]
MKVLRISILELIFILLSVSLLSQEIFITPNGNDTGKGTLGDPLQSIQKAKEKIISYSQEGKSKTLVVWLSGGMYPITEPIFFNTNEINFDGISIQFRALPNTNPIISGGIKITDWQQISQGLWASTLSQNMQPRELFIENKRASRSRFPDQGYLRVEKVGADRRTNFFFTQGDFPIPENTENTELVLLHDWSISRIPIQEINTDQNQITAVDSIGARKPDFFNLDHWEEHPRYFLENAQEFINRDYEWCFDKELKRIVVKLPVGMNPNNLEIISPISPALLQLNGTKSKPIKNIHFQGISFQHTYWEIPRLGYCGVQACHFDPRPSDSSWATIPAAIELNWAENCTFTNCKFSQFGGSGIHIGPGSRYCSVTNCDIEDISGNGIMIGEGRDRKINGNPWYTYAPGDVATGNSIVGSTVKKCGQQFFGAVGIWAGLTAETTIKNNNVYDLPYTGISIGWMWSPRKTPCRDNIIDGNHIYDIMKILSDGGGIYSLGLQPGSKLINNHIHDVQINAGRAESNGIFMDEGTTDVIVSNNLIYNIAKSPLRFHRAQENLVKENILFCTADNPPIRYNNTDPERIQKIENIIYYKSDPDYKAKLNTHINNWK